MFIYVVETLETYRHQEVMSVSKYCTYYNSAKQHYDEISKVPDNKGTLPTCRIVKLGFK
jgi:hypothetical protein